MFWKKIHSTWRKFGNNNFIGLGTTLTILVKLDLLHVFIKKKLLGKGLYTESLRASIIDTKIKTVDTFFKKLILWGYFWPT